MGNAMADARAILRVLRAQAGDRAALEELLTMAQPRLFAFLLRMLGHRQDAEDVLQDVLLIIARKLGWLQSARLFDAWSYRIAAREAGHRRRSRSRDPSAARTELRDDDAATEEPKHPAPDEITAVERYLSLLPANTREVVVLHYYENMSLSETADVLGIPVGTAKSRLASGLSSLRRAVSDGRSVGRAVAPGHASDENGD